MTPNTVLDFKRSTETSGEFSRVSLRVTPGIGYEFTTDTTAEGYTPVDVFATQFKHPVVGDYMRYNVGYTQVLSNGTSLFIMSSNGMKKLDGTRFVVIVAVDNLDLVPENNGIALLTDEQLEKFAAKEYKENVLV